MNSVRTIFSWLHLSDIHFHHGDSSQQDDQEMVLDELLEAFKKLTSISEPDIPNPDAVFITGDIANSGGDDNPNEYASADKWLTKLSNVISVDKNDIYIIPGNHDVQNKIVDDDVSLLLSALRDNRRKLGWALSDQKQRRRLVNRFKRFYEFSLKFGNSKCLIQNSDDGLFWQHAFPVGQSFSIRLIGLNSALISCKEGDKGIIRLSQNQIKHFQNATENNQISIALSHHPPMWLADKEDIEPWLCKKAHIHLCGHIHDPHSISYEFGGGANLIRVQAGAVHQNDKEIRHCFNVASIVEDSNGQLFLRIWNRMWSDRYKGFRDDPESHPENKRYAEHLLPFTRYRSKMKTQGKDDSLQSNMSHIEPFRSDSPPVVNIWVGRERELFVTTKFDPGVISITGIGGQGKSALAAKALEKWKSEYPDCFWDWRDCREQSEQFHSKLVSIIENISGGEILGGQLEGAQTTELVRALLNIANNHKGLIIIDNVDKYVDVTTRQFTLGLAKFVNAVLSSSHNLSVIITCRPRITYESPRFREFYLQGINSDDTLELFRIRDVKVDCEETSTAIRRIHELTNGHPFLLHLVATQIAQRLTTLDKTIDGLQHGQVNNQIITMMRPVWSGLNPSQRTILRYMAEFSRPQNIDWIFECVGTDIKHWSKFNPAFQHLITLNLITEAQGTASSKEYDLHPIVRNFIRNEFPIQDRKSFLDGVIRVVDLTIGKFGNSISITTISQIDCYIQKAELAIEKEDLETAIRALAKVGGEIVLRGKPGDLFRVGELIHERCKENNERLIDLDEFHEMNDLLGHSYVEYGRRDDAIKHLERYAGIVPKNTAHFIRVCNTASYVQWFLGNYEESILWAEEGLRIKANSNIDTIHNTAHNLALAHRDSGSVEKALSYFLGEFTIETFLYAGTQRDQLDASQYGNIGRCLQLLGQKDLALKSFVISARMLEKDAPHATTNLNIGYACLWIGDLLTERSEWRMAYIFYRRSEIIWALRAPLKADEPQIKAQSMLERLPDMSVTKISEIGIERHVQHWLDKFPIVEPKISSQ